MNRRVLVVDDDASIRSALKKVLEAEGFEVALAANGAEATERFKSGKTDLVILDLNLPGQSGWDIFEKLTRKNPSVPILVITALPNQCATAQAAGVGALLEKPLAVPVLLETMKRLLAEPPAQQLRRLCGYASDTRCVRAAGALSETPGPFATAGQIRRTLAHFQRPYRWT
jgi:DNA-binding response OmpR family regulator